MRIILPWSALAQANHRLMPVAVFDPIKKKHVGRMVPGTAYKEATKTAAAEVRRQLAVAPNILTGWVAVEYKFFEPDRRVRDPSNYQKLIEDVLSESVYADDRQIAALQWARGGISRKRPRVEILVLPLPLFELKEVD